MLRDWSYFYIHNGNCNNINLGVTLSRTSTDNPLFPRRGSELTASVTLTPPWSLFDKKDYSTLAKNSTSATCVRFEYNFWSYGNGQEYRGSKRLAPFITTGMGITHHSGENSGMTMSLLLGAGVKYKIGQRMNLTAEWGVRFSTSDKLDGRSDVYAIKSSGPFKNTDGYSVLQLALTYDLWAKCKTCNNDRY